MPDSEGAADGPDYGWLYGKKEQPAGTAEWFRGPRAHPGDAEDRPAGPRRRLAGADRRAATRRSPRSGRRSPPQPPAPPATTGPRGRAASVRCGKIVLLLLVAWLVFLVAVPLWAWSNIEKVDADPAGARPAEQPGTTYLLVGSDSRKGLSKAENKRLGTGGVGDVGQRTDTIMLLHTGRRTQPAALDPPRLDRRHPRPRAPPRSTRPSPSAARKLLVRTIEQNTGVRIDHYVEIGFGGFVNSVDAVGGIKICPTQRMVDRRANLRIKKGCQEVDGVTALGYARSRHVSKYGDIDRARHQREVVSAIGSEVKSPWTFINPIRYFRVNKAATSSLVISEGTGPIALAKFGLAMTRVNGSDGLTCSMPIADQAIHWDRQRALGCSSSSRTTAPTTSRSGCAPRPASPVSTTEPGLERRRYETLSSTVDDDGVATAHPGPARRAELLHGHDGARARAVLPRRRDRRRDPGRRGHRGRPRLLRRHGPLRRRQRLRARRVPSPRRRPTCATGSTTPTSTRAYATPAAR